MEPNGHAEMSPDGVLLIRSLRDEAVTQFDVRVSDGRDDEADAKSTAIVLNVILEKGTTDHVVHFYRPQIAMLLSSSQAERRHFIFIIFIHKLLDINISTIFNSKLKKKCLKL